MAIQVLHCLLAQKLLVKFCCFVCAVFVWRRAEYDCFLQKSCQVNELETSIGQKQFKKGQIKAE
jgi:hypothetical protein